MAPEALAAGYSYTELKLGGYPVSELLHACGHSAAELQAMGYGLRDLAVAGYAAEELEALGLSFRQLMGAGFRATHDELVRHSASVTSELSLSATRSKRGGGWQVRIHVQLNVSGSY